MKCRLIILVLAGYCLPALSQRPPKNYRNQYGFGYQQSPRIQINLDQGSYAIRPIKLVGLMLDYNRSTRAGNSHWCWGVRSSIMFYSSWWDLQKGNSYYTPHAELFTIDKFDHVELFGYIKKNLLLTKGPVLSLRATLQAGPAFNINGNLNASEGWVPLRTDNQTGFLACEVFHEKRQPPLLPYLRLGGALELIVDRKSGKNLILSPFAESALFQADKETFTSFPNDPAFLSKGHFKWNRTLLGCRLGLGR